MVNFASLARIGRIGDLAKGPLAARLANFANDGPGKEEEK